MKYFLFLVLMAWNIACFSGVYAKNSPFLIHSETHKIFLKADGTGRQEQSLDIELLTPEAATLMTPLTFEYDPTLKDLHIKDAYVLQPDGVKIKVSPDAIFTRPSLASTEAPGFVHTLTVAIIFPNLQVGSRVICTVVGKLKKQGPYGFLWKAYPPFLNEQKKFTLEIHAPLSKNFPLQVAERGDFFSLKDEEDSKKKERVITVSFKDWKGHEAEPGMLNPLNWLPYVVISSLKTWKNVAAVYTQHNEQQAIPDESVRTLAQSIVGLKKGKDAAGALYDWVAHNITYLFVSLDPTTAIKGHSASEVLQTKYGDCKDKVILLQALLKAIEIDSMPVLVNLTEELQEFTVLPYPAFNHVILYIPAYDVFADPTVQFASLGTLSASLYGTPALFVHASSPARKLPSFDLKEHTYRVKAELRLRDEGTLDGENIVETTGETATEFRAFFCQPGRTEEEIASEVLKMTPEGGTGAFKAGDIYALAPIFSFAGSWKTPKFLILEKETSFSLPYGLDPRLSLPFIRGVFTSKPRQYPFKMCPGIDLWEYTLVPPLGYRFGKIPENRFLETPGALYRATYTLEKGLLKVSRRLEIKKTIFTPQEAPQLLDPVELFLFDLRQSVFLKKE